MSLKLEKDLNPANRDRYNRAKAAAQSKNYDYAITLIQSILKEEPLFFEGRRRLRAVEIEKFNGLSSFNRQMQSMKVGSAAMKLSGAAKKTPEEQLLLAEEVLSYDPFHAKANQLIGDAGVALGHTTFKSFAYETLALGNPKDKAALNTLAQSYMETREYAKAIETYERILKIDRADGDALSGLKNAHAAESSKSGGWEKGGGDYRDALKNSTEATALERDNAVIKSAEALQERIQRDYQKWQEQPNNPVHSKAIAKSYEQLDDYASAISWYEEAFRAGNNIDTSLEKSIGDLKIKAGEQELKGLKEALAQQTDPEVIAQYQAAIEAKTAENLQVQLDLAEMRVRNYPNDGQYHYELGEVLFKVGQYKRALGELQLGLKQPSLRYHALNMMGQSFVKQNMLDLAIRRFSEAATELPAMDDLKKEIVYNLGLAYESSGDAAKALDQFKAIYEVDMAYRDVAARVESSYGGG